MAKKTEKPKWTIGKARKADKSAIPELARPGALEYDAEREELVIRLPLAQPERQPEPSQSKNGKWTLPIMGGYRAAVSIADVLDGTPYSVDAVCKLGAPATDARLSLSLYYPLDKDRMGKADKATLELE